MQLERNNRRDRLLCFTLAEKRENDPPSTFVRRQGMACKIGMLICDFPRATAHAKSKKAFQKNNKENRVKKPQIYEGENLFMLNIFFLRSSKYRMR